MTSETSKYRPLTVQGTTYETLLTGKYLRRTGWAPRVPGAVACVIPGVILKVYVRPGQRVGTGDPLVVLEAMKMQNDILAPSGGIVKRVAVAAGDQVARGQLIVEIS